MKPFGAAILGCEGTHLSDEEKRFFSKVNPFGFILFSRNLESTGQIRALTGALRDAVGWNAPIFVDQEGGRVQRMRPPLARDWLPPLQDVTRFGAAAAQAMALRYRIISAELLALGIDGNCSPALDVARPDTHAVLRNRLLGDTVDQVVTLGRAVAQAHLDMGVLPVIKHMPGHGLGTLDSHLELPRVNAPRAELDSVDFAAFAAFADMPLGMTCHLVFEGIDPRPSTISPVMIDLIRRQIGFDGFLMTDDISMQALSGTVPERGVAALAAGCDAVLHCNGDLAEMQDLMQAIGPMSEAAQARAARALAARKPPAKVDIAQLDAEFEALSLEHATHD
ncbi:glycoside hydrolase family 3 N-terminal domain-containing protein [Tropicibacter oceani]|uniref:beta-N-acetylhexosaminidase n=1 Tax=Tropicibacter oceani TaxID=3058420 RepID=A0ABY8QFG3_9RHOB|nr:glycoside hydrolase family 3 N-terminal domain-containing protein [Tropicibacter oceani]WGW02748.1 glycoside hydrolase family 3 N-terminal domain-containing protein [Tropicibacter oceani]